MGCSVNHESASFLSLPPGCRFYPSEEQLLCYYLPKKNRSPGLGDEGGSSSRSTSVSVSDAGFHVIKDVNLYDYDPFDLPGAACFSHGYGGRKRHWYCYAPEMKGSWRKAGAGFWKRFGRVRVVMGRGGKVALGTRKSFVFHTGNASNSKTDWVMHEYALTGQSKASFVLCRVFIRSQRRNNTSDHGLSSCAEECFTPVKHIGIQNDGSLTQADQCNNFVIEEKAILECPDDCSLELNDQVTARPVSNEGIQHSFGLLLNHTLGLRENAGDGVSFNDASQEDYIELDDLVEPLIGVH